MTNEQRRRELLRQMCAEIREDDGIDPRDLFKPTRKRDKSHRKSKQLCRQIGKTLDLVLSGEIRDESLNCLKVVSIEQGADASQLVVSVIADMPPAEFHPQLIQEGLKRIEGRLREAIAASISRKKTPHLEFVILAPPTQAILEQQDAEET